MQFYNFQGSPGNNHREENSIEKLQAAVKAFEKDVSTTKTIHADSDSIQQLLNIFSDILEDGFEGQSDEENDFSHYWSTVSSVIDSIPMRFVNSLEKFDTDSEKAIVWILIELYDKNLLNVFNDILNKPQIMQFYSDRSIMQTKASKVKDILHQLNNFDYSIESKFLKVYVDNKDQFVDEEEEEEEGEMSDRGSVFIRGDSTISHQPAWTSNLYQRQTQEPSDMTVSDISMPVSHRDRITETPAPAEMSKSEPNEIRRLVTHVDEVKQNLQRYKTLLKRPTLTGKDEDDDNHVFVREDYRKDLEERNKKNPFGFISKVLEPMNNLKGEATKKIMRKSSSYDKLDTKGQSGKGDYIKSKGNLDEDDGYHNQRKRESRRSSYELKRNNESSNSPEIYYYKKHTGNGDRRFTRDQNEGYHSGLGGFRASELKGMRNSQLLYYEKYQGIQLQFEYRAKPENVPTAEQQGYKCFDCGTELNKILLKIWPRKFFCHYTGYWYCSTCMGKEKHLIPWYVQSNFDFGLYHVCKKAREELKKFYDKPNMLFDHREKVVLENKDFYDTLVMKRQLHLLFDMICESPYVLDLLGTNANLLLKQNLFSMKNLSEIKNGTMPRYMEKCYAMLTSHVSGCSICEAKGKYCPACNNKTKIYPFDIKNTSVCRNCKYLYHSRCLQLKKCIVCQHNS